MCGIACIYQYHRNPLGVDRNELRLMRDAMHARGPDAQGEWYSDNDSVGLAHRRLSIIDLSEQSAQPMKSHDGKIVISFNGEIYNYQALRAQLETKGYQFSSHSDTEVLLNLYSEKGIRMLDDLRGMFAFALWDAHLELLLLARDPYGIKPLYYANNGGTIRAASQVRALLAGGKISREHELAAVAGFYLLGSVLEPWTMYRDIQALPAGTYLLVDRMGASVPKSYCSIASILADASQTYQSLSEKDAAELISSALKDSVAAHLVADVPVGLFLSSGIDSSALAGLAAEQGQLLQALTLGFKEYAGKSSDEVPLAIEIAGHYGLKHHAHRISQHDFNTMLPEILADMDQPSIDGINTWLVSRAASKLGWKVALSGVGGDELLGGYPSFRDIPNCVSRLAIPSSIPMLGSIFYRLLSPFTVRRTPKIAGLVKYGGTFVGAYLLRRGLFLPEELSAVMGRDMAEEGLRRLGVLSALQQPLEVRSWQGVSSQASILKVSAMESSFYMRNQLLRDADWAGMAHSLEIRTPLVDIELLRRVAPALMSLKLGAGKQVLAVAPSAPLPDHIRLRPKTGFTVPMDKWLQQNMQLDAWRDVSILCHPRCPWGRRWAHTVMSYWRESRA